MKKIICTLLCLSAAFSQAALEKWTNKEGRTVEMELTKVTTAGEVKVAEFRTKAGKTVILKTTDLSDESAMRVNDWTPGATAAVAATTTPEAATASTGSSSVFDSVLDGNLEKIDGKSVKSYKPDAKPAKFYVFYHSASWCGPCHKYTPSLVALYEKLKPANKDFELILITHDSDEKAMEGYMKEKQMPWPALKLSKTESYNKKFNHGVSGIPSVVVCKLDGTVLAKTQDLNQIEKILTGK